MKRALIFGITGQDGAYLAKLLLRKGHYQVIGTSRNPSANGANANLTRLGIAEKIQIVSVITHQFDSVFKTISEIRPDEIYNLSGQTSVGASFDQPLVTFESIATATLNILESIRLLRLPTRFYNAGSGDCFGECGETPADENTPFCPNSPYAVSKISAYELVANYRQAYKMFACTGILFNHESPLRPQRFVTPKIISAARRIAAELSAGKKPEPLELGNLFVKRDWGWTPEYVESMHLMLQRETPEDFVIATGQLRALEDFVRLAFGYVGLNWQDHVKVNKTLLRRLDPICSWGNPKRAEQVLRWKAKFHLEQIVQALFDLGG